MKTTSFILYVLAAIVLEMFLKLIFPGSIIVVVPEVLIFLAVIDLDAGNILHKVAASAILYDLAVGQQIGVVSLSILLVFGVLYFLAQFSHVGGKRIKNMAFGPALPAISIFLSLLSGLYYVLSYILEDLFFNIYNGQELLALEFPPASLLFFIMGMAVVIFIVLFLSHSVTKGRFSNL